MKRIGILAYARLPLLATIVAITVGQLPAANLWISPSNGLWRITNNWSLAKAPDGTSALDPTLITNAGTKTITIDSATAAVNLSIRGLTVSAPVGSTNTLAMVDATNAVFTTSRPFLVGTRGALTVTNTAITNANTFDISNATVVLNSGSLSCPINCDLQAGSFTVNGGTVTTGPLSTGIRMGRFNSANATLNLNGGNINTLRITLGSVSGSQNTLNLYGGTLNCAETFSAAQIQNTTGAVTMTNGNLIVTNGSTLIGDRGTASFTLSGGTATFADLRIGDTGVGTNVLTGGQLNVNPRTTNDFTIIGNHGEAYWQQSGGTAVIHGELHISDFEGDPLNSLPASIGVVSITGGQLIATNDLVAIGRYGIGSMLVSNATVVLTNASVGRHPLSDGTLTIENGGNVTLLADLSIARLTNSTGHVFVNGGTLALTNDDLWVGRGGTGDMTINGGTVTAKALHVGESDDGIEIPTGTLTINGGTTVAEIACHVGSAGLSNGIVTMNGGSLFATNAPGTNLFSVANGNFTMNGGTVTADILTLTNSIGSFTLNNGLLRAKTMTVSNGLPFVVGDGANPATLQLMGGIYTFVNGLVISPNATVTGCGTIIGSVTNNGTRIDPCSGPAAPVISSVSRVGAGASISLLSSNGISYTLEYKNALTDPGWTQILPAQPGNGGILILSDPAATNRTRFYRVGAH